MSNSLGIGKKMLAMAVAIAFVTVLVPISVRGEVSDYWAPKDVGVRMEPHYENIAYSLDPIETLQRFDAKGDWYWPATTDMNDSKLILTAATNATFNVVNDANLNDGKYYEVRVKATATANFTFKLIDDATHFLSIYLAANQGIRASYTAAASTVTTTSMGTWAGDTWIVLGIDMTLADTTFYAYYDTNRTVIGYKVATTQNLTTYADITEVSLAQSVAAKTAYVDYFVQTSGHTDMTPVGQASRALRIDSEETEKRRNLAFTLDDLKDVITLSNDTGVQSAIGYTATGKDLSNDNKINETDLGQIIAETPEDVDAKFRGTAVVKGWDSTGDAVDESLENYLADRHDVSKVYVIDYYIDDMKFNISVSDGMATKVEKTALKNFMADAEDQGGEINYDSDVGLRSDWTDFDYAYMPRDITSAKFTDMKTDLSNEIRKKCFSMVALTQARPSDVVDPMIESPLAMGIPFTGKLNLGTTFQETNALIGSILQGRDYTLVDAETVDAQMASSSASGFNTMEDGKTAHHSSDGLSLIVTFVSYVLWACLITILVVSALLIVVMVRKHRKHKKHKKQ